MKRAFRIAICVLSIAIPVALVIGELWYMLVLLAATLLTLAAAMAVTW